MRYSKINSKIVKNQLLQDDVVGGTNIDE